MCIAVLVKRFTQSAIPLVSHSNTVPYFIKFEEKNLTIVNKFLTEQCMGK
jgi:hypothetical protein